MTALKFIAICIFLLGLYNLSSVVLFPWTVKLDLANFLNLMDAKAAEEFLSLVYKESRFTLFLKFVTSIGAIASSTLIFKSNKTGAYLFLATCFIYFAGACYDTFEKGSFISLVLALMCIVSMGASYFVFRLLGILPNQKR